MGSLLKENWVEERKKEQKEQKEVQKESQKRSHQKNFISKNKEENI